MKKLTARTCLGILLLLFVFASFAYSQTTYSIKTQAGIGDLHPEVWQMAYCPTEGGNNFNAKGHGSTPEADTSATYAVPAFNEIWLRVLPDDDSAATGTDSIDAYVVIEVMDDQHVETGMTYNGWRRIDSVACAITDTLYGVWYEATKVPPCTHLRTLVVTSTDNDRGGRPSFKHWIVFKQ